MTDVPKTTWEVDAWRAGAVAMKAEAVGCCDVVLRLLQHGAISGSPADLIKAIRDQIASSPIPEVPHDA